MSNTQAERVEALAAQHGTRYVNRHFPDKASYGFSQEELQAFAAVLVAENEALKADAERWRWLSDDGRGPNGAVVMARMSWDTPDGEPILTCEVSDYEQEADAALAARNTTQQQGG